MSKLIVAVFFSLLTANVAFAVAPAQSTSTAPGSSPATTATAPSAANCEGKAIDTNGKPLAGEAKASFIKKCQADAVGKK
jgi:hypothetical protein